MKNIKKTTQISIAIIVLFFLLLVYCFSKDANVLFASNLLLCLFICLKAKFSIFSLKTILINYVLISICSQYNTGFSYGILQISPIELHYSEMMLLAFIYNFIMYLFVECSDVIKLEKDRILSKEYISRLAAYFCSIVAIASAIIAFPSIPFAEDYYAHRFEALLPGNAWNHLTIISLLLAYPKLKKSHFVKFAYIFCFAWFLIHGERVDMIGLAICLIILFAASKIYANNGKNIKTYVKCALVAIPLVLVLVGIGEYRVTNKIPNPANMLKRVLVQGTASDVGYVYNVAIHHKENEGLMYGQTYLNYLYEIIPFFTSDYEAAEILRQKYNTPGGILILAEPYMNFGVIGLIVFEVIELFVLYKLLKSRSTYTYFVYLFLVVTTFRTSWYGLKYIQTGLLYLMPVLYLIVKFINGKVTKKVKKNATKVDFDNYTDL